MNVTAKDAIERYQSQVPRLKLEFSERLKELRARFPREEQTPGYRAAIAEAIASEIRRRMTIAGKSLSEALDAGWRPNADQLDQAFTDSLNALDLPRKSFDDLFSIAGYIPGKAGGGYERVIGETMVACSSELSSELLMHLRKLLATEKSRRGMREYKRARTQRSSPATKGFRLTTVALTNFKSIAQCTVPLQKLTILVGANGSGKSNFIDSIDFVNEALYDSIEYAVRERGGIAQLIRQTPGADPYLAETPPLSDIPYFEIRLSFMLGSGVPGSYQIRVGQRGMEFDILSEECVINGAGTSSPSYFTREGAEVKSSAELWTDPKDDRLYLPTMTSIEPFGDVFDALTSAVVYYPSLSEICDAQPLDSGSYLADDCWNIASVVSRLQTKHSRIKQRVETYLRRIVRSHVTLRSRTTLPYIFLEFWQRESETDEPLRLLASSMSDGTLRATALLIALLQPPEIDADKALALVAFEEPETGLQPAALRVLFDAIQESSQSRQVVLTTHSPDLLDNKNLEVDSILAVEFREGSTRIGPIDSITRKVLRDGLVTPSELLRQTNAFRPA